MEKLMKQGIDHGEDNLKKRQQCWRIMEVLPELSLGPSPECHEVNKSTNDDQSSPESESSNLCRKRKSYSGHLFHSESNMTSVDLQLKDPLPLDWEQCLDLATGRMYYLNRKTLRKSWERPKEQNLDLELNISSSSSSNNSHRQQLQTEQLQGSKKQQQFGSSNNMVALACSNCHLLVILSKSSPSCPNCKYIHSLPSPPPPPKVGTNNKSAADTLSLLMN